MDPRYLFVSHAKADNPLVTAVVADLGVPVWADPVRYDGTAAESILGAAITHSSGFVVLLTENSIRRPWVRWEVRTALTLPRLPIVPIIADPNLDDDALPEPFDALSRFDPVPLADSVAAIRHRLAAYVGVTI
jgi:hypothetical protein